MICGHQFVAFLHVQEIKVMNQSELIKYFIVYFRNNSQGNCKFQENIRTIINENPNLQSRHTIIRDLHQIDANLSIWVRKSNFSGLQAKDNSLIRFLFILNPFRDCFIDSCHPNIIKYLSTMRTKTFLRSRSEVFLVIYDTATKKIVSYPLSMYMQIVRQRLV